MIHSQRLTVSPDKSFVVFVIGARVNKWWLALFLWPFFPLMPRMLGELSTNPDLGLLHSENWFGRTTISVQYWRSIEDLMSYAHSKERSHAPAWKQWADKIGISGALGIWHETYVIEPGSYESVYHHMPSFGLGKAFPLVPAEGKLNSARGRRAGGRKAAVTGA